MAVNDTDTTAYWRCWARDYWHIAQHSMSYATLAQVYDAMIRTNPDCANVIRQARAEEVLEDLRREAHAGG